MVSFVSVPPWSSGYTFSGAYFPFFAITSFSCRCFSIWSGNSCMWTMCFSWLPQGVLGLPSHLLYSYHILHFPGTQLSFLLNELSVTDSKLANFCNFYRHRCVIASALVRTPTSIFATELQRWCVHRIWIVSMQAEMVLYSPFQHDSLQAEFPGAVKL